MGFRFKLQSHNQLLNTIANKQVTKIRYQSSILSPNRFNSFSFRWQVWNEECFQVCVCVCVLCIHLNPWHLYTCPNLEYGPINIFHRAQCYASIYISQSLNFLLVLTVFTTPPLTTYYLEHLFCLSLLQFCLIFSCTLRRKKKKKLSYLLLFYDGIVNVSTELTNVRKKGTKWKEKRLKEEKTRNEKGTYTMWNESSSWCFCVYGSVHCVQMILCCGDYCFFTIRLSFFP